MSLFKRFKKQLDKNFIKLKNGAFINITSEKLKQNVEFVLHTLPNSLVKGMVIIEEVFEREAEPHQIILKETMNAMDIKRQIGHFVFQEKRWKEQEEISRKLLAQEKIDLEMFYEVYETKDYLTIYQKINADVFAVYYGNKTMNVDEIAIAINSLYIKRFADKNFSNQHKIENLIEKLFSEQEKNKE